MCLCCTDVKGQELNRRGSGGVYMPDQVVYSNKTARIVLFIPDIGILFLHTNILGDTWCGRQHNRLFAYWLLTLSTCFFFKTKITIYCKVGQGRSLGDFSPLLDLYQFFSKLIKLILNLCIISFLRKWIFFFYDVCSHHNINLKKAYQNDPTCPMPGHFVF